MSDDRDIDRLVADHLNQSARRLPDHVVDSVLEGIPTQRQESATSLWAGRAGRALLAIGTAAVVIIAVVIGPSVVSQLGIGPGAAPTPTPQFVWDAHLNFRGSPVELNPSPDSYGHPAVWSYLHSASAGDPVTYEQFTEFDTPTDSWVDVRYPGLKVGSPLPTPALTLHPYRDNRGNDRVAIVAWRSPIAGPINIVGDVEVDGACGDGIDFRIDRGPAELQRFLLPSGSRAFDLHVDVSVGETIYWIVGGGNAGSSCDTTWLKVTISG